MPKKKQKLTTVVLFPFFPERYVRLRENLKSALYTDAWVSVMVFRI